MKLLIRYIIITILCLNSYAGDNDIKKKQNELQKLQKEIDLWEQKLENRQKKEKATLELLDSYDQQLLTLRKLLKNLRDDQKSIEKEIDKTKLKIDEIEKKLGYIKKQYTKYVINAYKHGKIYDLELLVTAKSYNQLLVRSKYLQKFSEYRKRDIQKIGEKFEELQTQQNILENQLVELNRILQSKAMEEKRLLARSEERKKILAQIKRDKQNFQKELERKKKAVKDLENLIAKLIEEEEKHKEKDIKTSYSESTPGNFELRKGKLPWPVKSGKLIGKFGTQQHPILKTYSNNTGIDIAVPQGTNVHAIAEGVVATIWWLPSYGNLLIINHFNNYRTVYANLSEIDVNEGDRVTEGTIIGKSGESINGAQIHFEIWKGREKQNPELWLHPQEFAKR